MMRYVLGFMFSADRTKVAMIRKIKPRWQAGLLNGVGGKLEPREWADDAMVREFREETGIEHKVWDKRVVMHREGDFRMEVYRCFTDNVFNVRTTTEEVVTVVHVDAILAVPQISVPNMKWLLPMVLDDELSLVDCNYAPHQH